MTTTLQALSVSYDYLTGFPGNLNNYSAIFVCLGIYSYNHVLTNSEGQLLADYLNAGGNLFMEGGDTWAYDPSTPVHSMFNIDDISDGLADLSTVSGISGTFTDGLSFNYSGENYWIDRLGALSSAKVIFENTSPSYYNAVAFDGGSYKTIGTSFEYGGLDNSTAPSTRTNLMHLYLDFFGIPNNYNSTVPTNLEVGNQTINNGQDTCYDATNTITVAGSGNPVTVNSGGNATFIAGYMVSIKPGVRVYAGGYFSAYIAPGGPFCGSQPPSMLVAVEEIPEPELLLDTKVKIYPNPTTGKFTIELINDLCTFPIDVVVYDFIGKPLFVERMLSPKIEIDLTGFASGVYFIRLDYKEKPEIFKLIKLFE